MAFKKRTTIWLGMLLFLVVVGIAVAYRYVVNGGMIARQKPTAIEKHAARFLLNLSVPRQAKELKSSS